MSGPIVRTGTTPEFWKNWDRAFGDKKKTTDKPVDKAAAKAVKTAAPKKAVAKATKPAKSKAAKKSK